MTASTSATPGSAKPRHNLLYDPKVRGILFQVALILGLIFLFWEIAHNVAINLARLNVASGFGFLESRAGFDMAQTLIPYTNDSTYGRAILTGFLNTLLVAVVGIVLATIVGFLVGIAQLSPNWLLRQVTRVYIELFRNVPLLVSLLFWYKGVLAVLPAPRQGYELGFGMILSNRGLSVPRGIAGDLFWLTPLAFALGAAALVGIARWNRQRQLATGQRIGMLLPSLGLLLGLPLVVFLLTGAPLSFEYPELKGFNFAGGTTIIPELLALELGLVIYTSAFIAETVRAGIQAISKGQSEAAFALGLRPGVTTRLVIVPQAMRVIIPPLTSQYLNLTKNSSLALAIGYPDLVAVAGTVLNQSGQALEVIGIVMLTYLTLSLLTSAFMNWFNARVALVER
ncbi:amino acid ABC transporter permease [Mongoliimonas terrestris]|uniref:amino acid ABC transporter permease n=1 Tax=Mongoliimonas terrestris TaxID=1709001 RepID=UPI0009498AEE|nr:amino acid ABC transporter permease [Mongoliimonas terrestris]